ncbi:MAG: ROK family transcriptional regulator [Nakamurella sp.]
MRRLNAHIVLEYLRDSGAVTATEIMAATGLSRPTVHAVCDDWIGLGWVTEVEGRKPEGAGRPGRRNRCYEFNSRAGFVLGIDLGATSIRVRLSDLRGENLAEEIHHSGHAEISGRDRIAQTRRTIKLVLTAAGVAAESVLATAVGVASPVDSGGRAYGAEHYLRGLSGDDLRKLIGRGYSWPVLLENDADLAVLGERWRGVAVGIDNIIVLLAGERLGAGMYLSGRLIRGHRGGAGEMAFLRFVDQVGNTDGIAQTARKLGTLAVGLEAVLAGEAVPVPHALPASNAIASSAATATSGATPAPETRFRSRLFTLAEGDPNRVEAGMVFAAARDSDQVAHRIVEQVAERMARIIGILATLLNPEVLVLAGAFAPSLDVLLPPLNRRVAAYTEQLLTVRASGLGDNGVVLGATRLAIDHVESETFERVSLAQ